MFSFSKVLRGIKGRLFDLLNLSPKVKKVLKVVLILTIIFELIKVIPPILFKEIIDWMVQFNPEEPVTLKFIAILVCGYFVSMLVMTAIEVVGKKMVFSRISAVEYDLTIRSFKKLLALDLTYHEKHNTGTSINKVLKGVHRVVDILFRLAEQLFPSIIQATITFVILSYLNWIIGLSFLVFVPLFVIVLIYGSTKTQKVREQYHKKYDQFAGLVNQSMSNIRTVKDFDNEEKELAKSRKVLNRFLKLILKRVKLGYRNMLWEDIIINTARFLTLGLSVWLMMNVSLTAGGLVLVMTLTEKAYLNLARLSRVYYHMQDAAPSIDRFKSIQQAPIRIKDKPKSARQIKQGRIEFENVTFKYGRKEYALRGIRFTVPAKSVAAFVGRSGSGKTTLMKLLLRHFDVTSGEIRIDGVPIDEYSLANLRKDVAIVSQDVELFNETIFDNIAYGVKKANRQEVIKVAKLAHAHEFIMQFPKGYETLVGERGVKLSGGQKQRIAIARALLTKPKIMIFDEATSSLDSESEKFIHESIFGLVGKLTLIIIAHRFSTIEHADKIILLEKGKVKEIGTHEELMNKKGIFAKLRKLQELGEFRKDKPEYHKGFN